MPAFSGFQSIWESLYSVIRTMSGWDILDIAMLTYVIYYFFKLMRETRAGQLFKGIAFLLLVYLFGKVVELKAITYLLERLFSFGILALLIVFQPEVRRAVEKLGHSRFGLSALGLIGSNDEITERWRVAIEEICDACVELSATCTGALIVIEQQTRLGEQIENGTIVNAIPSKELFGNIFYPKTPLHDGAVIMRDGLVLAAACFLPKPQKEELINKKLGSRHRAAIGMSENSDAVVIVVSEETGQISVAENGTLTRNLTREKLHSLLTDRLIPKQNESRLSIPGIRRSKKKEGQE
ncbi:MAG: diadenylate cyclase CdaA [Oscillospiraceae bacterium]|nr:diadenylate cyclase CdaA [Oscillospiraceae bacterium]